MDIEIKELISRSIKGDASAFEQLIADHQQKIFNLAYRLTGNYHDASDLSQEALIRIFKALPNYRGDAAFYSWAYSIVTNLYRDYLRKQSRKKEEYLDNPLQLEDDTIERQIGSSQYEPSKAYEDKEESEYLKKLVANLPIEYREVLVYRDFLGYSYQEIAEKFDIALGTVKSRINRGRKLLQEQILKDKFLHTSTTSKHNEEAKEILPDEEQNQNARRHIG